MKYETKDSGERIDVGTGYVRDINNNKPAFALMMPKDMPYDVQLITRWADIMRRGANKYRERNWERACTEEELERFKDSAMRHFIQWICGEADEDHAAAVLFNINGAEYVSWRLANEDQCFK